ncbi:trimeric intracellular cation channel family protein [Brevundimonas sp. 2R-24]|uniref:Trimeric intracellular cation channel family protein n=1 Tax=Peiella sedimenti TaxID=3061083 RepID=A0ABT8SN82_9CAUL|nr:trimeric intracellular cation channel family protein [Caulobacteraceae bacterium XZ-24]
MTYELGVIYLLLTYGGVAVFAASGALAAAARKHDVITFAFFAAITGVGGGTLRDVMLDTPVFWIADPAQLAVCVAVGALVWLIGVRPFSGRLLLWLDAIGLAAFAVLGAAKAVALGAPALVAVVMGVMTATAGGIIRDVMAGEPSVLLRREIYITAAMAGAAVFVVVEALGYREIAGAAGFVVGLGIRASALRFGWTMPAFFGGVVRRRPE